MESVILCRISSALQFNVSYTQCTDFIKDFWFFRQCNFSANLYTFTSWYLI